MRARLVKLLRPQAMELIRQQVEQEEQAAVKQANQQSATLKRQCESLLKCADKLLAQLDITIKQADALNSWLRVAPKEANEHQQARREDACYNWSVVEKPKVENQSV